MPTDPYQLSLQADRTLSVDLENLEAYSGQYWRSDIAFSGVADAATENIQIKTGSELVFLTSLGVRISDGSWNINLIEDPTITDGTTSVSIVNLNRNVSETNNVSIFNDPSSVSGGTDLSDYDVFDPGPATTGAGEEGILRWVLKPNSDYVIQLTNNSGGSADITVVLEFKEHQDTS